MNIRSKLWNVGGSALLAVMLGASLSLLLCASLMLPVDWMQMLLVSAALAAWCALVLCGWLPALMGTLAGGGALLLLVWYGGARPLQALCELAMALVAFNTGGEAMLTEHALTIACTLTTVFTLISFLMTRLSGGVYPALTLTLIVLLVGWFIERQVRVGYLLPALAALAALFSRSYDEGIPYLRALPMAVLAALLALLLLPSGSPTAPPLVEAAEKVRQMFYDYFMFTDPRTTYSVRADGYQPQGDLLGGPASPLDDSVMLVSTDASQLLLRGSIKRTYTTRAWVDNALNNRYLYLDPLKRGYRDQVFDANRALPQNTALRERAISVSVLREGTSALFVPHRMTDLKASLDLAVYYNNSGEVFIPRGVRPGDAYQMTALLPNPDGAGMEDLLSQLQAQSDPQYEQARADYLALPRGIEQGVYQLVYRLIEGAQSPYERAMRLQAHLQRNYAYTLDVDYPPADRDFVSYFLLDGGEGYCTYFASAMAVMARIADLPSRYVEGYFVRPEADGSSVVTGRDAHAWVEIYFQGFGWLSFNPTPGDDARSGDGNAPPPDEPDEPDEPGEPEEPEETEPPEQPEEEPTPAPEEPGDEPEEEPPADEEMPPDEPDEPDEPEPDEPEEPPVPPLVWGALLLLLALGALSAWIVRRLRRSNPALAERALPDAASKLILWYRALQLVLEQMGAVPRVGETPAGFAGRLAEEGLVGAEYAAFIEALSKSRYAKAQPGEEALCDARAAYALLTGKLKPMERARWMKRRILDGLGSMTVVP